MKSTIKFVGIVVGLGVLALGAKIYIDTTVSTQVDNYMRSEKTLEQLIVKMMHSAECKTTETQPPTTKHCYASGKVWSELGMERVHRAIGNVLERELDKSLAATEYNEGELTFVYIQNDPQTMSYRVVEKDGHWEVTLP